MKVLVTGYHNPHYETVTEYMERAVRALGHDLVGYDDARHIIPGRLRSRVRVLEEVNLRHINRRLLALARRAKPEVVLVTGGDRIRKDTIEALKAAGVLTVLWTTDPPRGCMPHLRVAPHYDRIFCQGSEFVELLRERII